MEDEENENNEDEGMMEDFEENGGNHFGMMMDEEGEDDELKQISRVNPNRMTDEDVSNPSAVDTRSPFSGNLNENQKRPRPIFMGDDDIEPMDEKQCYEKLRTLKPYTTPIVRIPGYRRPQELQNSPTFYTQFLKNRDGMRNRMRDENNDSNNNMNMNNNNSNNNNNNFANDEEDEDEDLGPIITDEDTQKRIKEWQYEQNKEEIRQLIRINKMVKKKAVDGQKQIDNIAGGGFQPVFTIGEKSSDKSVYGRNCGKRRKFW